MKQRFFCCYLIKSQDCTIHTGYRVPGMKKGSLFFIWKGPLGTGLNYEMSIQKMTNHHNGDPNHGPLNNEDIQSSICPH